MRNNIGSILKDLRLHKGITQKQLADETGLSLSAIKSYENSNREPNSKAMVALEKYFKVSGDYLMGNLDKNTFFENSKKVNAGLDLLVEQFLIFKDAFNISSQDKQLIVLPLMEEYIKTITSEMLVDSTIDLIKLEDFNQLFKTFISLNADGQNELLKRCSELSMLPQYSSKN